MGNVENYKLINLETGEMFDLPERLKWIEVCKRAVRLYFQCEEAKKAYFKDKSSKPMLIAFKTLERNLKATMARLDNEDFNSILE